MKKRNAETKEKKGNSRRNTLFFSPSVTGTAKVTSLERSWETHVDITGVITVEQKLVFEVSLFYCLVLTYSSFFQLWCNVVLLNATNVQLYKIVVVQNENILCIISLHRGSFIVLLSSFLRCQEERPPQETKHKFSISERKQKFEVDPPSSTTCDQRQILVFVNAYLVSITPCNTHVCQDRHLVT